MRFPGYDDTKTGIFENADDLRATLTPTEQQGWYLYTAREGRPMRFVRQNGEIVEPGTFFSDLGTIPRFLRIGRLLQPDSYPAVALIHDWLVRRHNCGDQRYGFRESILIQQEALKTWMETHPKDRCRLIFWLTRQGLKTKRSKDGWDYRFANCPPTLDELLAAQRSLSRRR